MTKQIIRKNGKTATVNTVTVNPVNPEVVNPVNPEVVNPVNTATVNPEVVNPIVFNLFEKVPVKVTNRGINAIPAMITLPTFANEKNAKEWLANALKASGSRSHFLSGLMLGQPISNPELVRCLELAGYYKTKQIAPNKWFATVDSHYPSGQKWFNGFKIVTTSDRSISKKQIVAK